MRHVTLALSLLAGALAAVCLPAAGIAPAAAAELALPQPKGYCALPNIPFRRLVSTNGGDFATNNLNMRQLQAFAECGRCPQGSATPSCSSGYGLYLENPNARHLAGLSRPAFLERIEQTFGFAQPPRMSEVAAALTRKPDVVSLGVLHRDEVGAYVGYLYRDQNSLRPWVALIGYTVVGGRIILLKLGAPYRDEATIQSLLNVEITSLGKLVRAN